MARHNVHLLHISLSILLSCCLLGHVSSQTSAPPLLVNSTGPAYAVNNSTAPPTTDNGNLQCHLEAVDEVVIRDDLQRFLGSGAKLIEMTMVVEGRSEDFLDEIGGHVFRGSHWIRSTSRRGRSLLMLEENYDILSLHLLSIGVEKMKVRLKEVPARCLDKSSVNATEALLQELLLNDFYSSRPGGQGSLSPDEHVCNVHVLDEDGMATFHYCCCHRVDSETRCTYVDRDVWISLLLACVLLIKVLVVLFSPNFLPESLYSEKYTAQEYVYHTDAKKRVRVVVTKFPSVYSGKNIIKLSGLAGMNRFRLSLNMMKMDVLYDVQMDKVRLAVKGRRLLAENIVPVGFFSMVYNNIARCKIRKLSPFEGCCHRSICGSLSPNFRVLPWYKFLRATMRLLILFLLMVPWLLRLASYYTYEGDRADRKRQVATDRGLDLGVTFRGSFTIFLTPLHGIFIAIYAIILIDSLFYGVIRKRMKQKFKLVLRKCLRDMRGRSRLEVCGWATRLALKPFELFGLFGLLLVVPFMALLSPVLLVVLVFYMVPFINLTLRLIIHMFIFICPNRFNDMMDHMLQRIDHVKKRLNLEALADKENFEKKRDISTSDVLVHILIMAMCLLSFWSITFLLMECLSFFVEIGVYTLVGIIVNADVTVRYLTVFFFLYLYGNSCLGGVRKMYVAFHNTILCELVKRNRASLEKIASQDSEEQDNTVFRVKGYTTEPSAEEDGEQLLEVGEANVAEAKFTVKKGAPFWHTRSFLVFLDSKDQPRCPEKLFHETIMMPYCGCPGSVALNYFRALMELMKIVIFLIFVVIVVMAFGDAYTISSTNQMLATVAGGFLPFVFRNFFKSSNDLPSLDAESLQFKSELNAVISKFEQGWPIWDMNPISVREVSNRFSISADMDLSRPAASTPVENKGENSNNFHDGVTSLTLDEPQVDLIVDMSTYNERHFGEMNRSGTTGSLSMLADTGRGVEDVKIYKGPTDREREIV